MNPIGQAQKVTVLPSGKKRITPVMVGTASAPALTPIGSSSIQTITVGADGKKRIVPQPLTSTSAPITQTVTIGADGKKRITPVPVSVPVSTATTSTISPMAPIGGSAPPLTAMGKAKCPPGCVEESECDRRIREALQADKLARKAKKLAKASPKNSASPKKKKKGSASPTSSKSSSPGFFEQAARLRETVKASKSECARHHGLPIACGATPGCNYNFVKNKCRPFKEGKKFKKVLKSLGAELNVASIDREITDAEKLAARELGLSPQDYVQMMNQREEDLDPDDDIMMTPKKKKRASPSSPSGRLSKFEQYNQAKREADLANKTSFEFNGNIYVKGEWSNGVGVWKRADGASSPKRRILRVTVQPTRTRTIVARTRRALTQKDPVDPTARRRLAFPQNLPRRVRPRLRRRRRVRPRL